MLQVDDSSIGRHTDERRIRSAVEDDDSVAATPLPEAEDAIDGADESEDGVIITPAGAATASATAASAANEDEGEDDVEEGGIAEEAATTASVGAGGGASTGRAVDSSASRTQMTKVETDDSRGFKVSMVGADAFDDSDEESGRTLPSRFLASPHTRKGFQSIFFEFENCNFTFGKKKPVAFI